jgi:hypothetical protein
VHIFHGTTLVAEHRRSSEPHTTVIDRSHLDGLWRRASTVPSQPEASPLRALGRSLDDYAAVVGGTR